MRSKRIDYTAGKADVRYGAHTTPMEPLIPTFTVKVHKRYPWGNQAEGGTGPFYLYIIL